LGKETQPTLCIKERQTRLGIISLGTNKDQLLHRIQSVQTSLIYNICTGTKVAFKMMVKLTNGDGER